MSEIGDSYKYKRYYFAGNVLLDYYIYFSEILTLSKKIHVQNKRYYSIGNLFGSHLISSADSPEDFGYSWNTIDINTNNCLDFSHLFSYKTGT